MSLGPCFGFCPVYDVTIDPKGKVVFDGQRHTQVIGRRERMLKPRDYAALVRELAPFRPASGTTAPIECEVAISDTGTYTISWIDAGGRTTVATHRRRCPSGAGHDLDQVLRDLPTRLGIADWARQTTRPDVPRG
ncbi:hypothetical protein EV292_102639 [Sphingomonas sp. BK235]|nr:hypothetical protein EV292_102639 [Sphingomonas sp. BK235]